MSTPTTAAKAAAVLHHTYGIDDRKVAAQIYDRLLAGEPMNDVFDEHDGVGVWECVEQLNEKDIVDNIVSLAYSIDACFEELP